MFRKWLIKLLGGYADLESVILSVEDDEERHLILTKAVSHLYNVISKDDILKETPRGWMVQGKVMSPERSKMLTAEADMFLKGELWKVLSLDISYQANKQMYEKATTQYDVVFGKISLYNMDIMKTRLESLVKGKGTFNEGK